MKPKKISRDMGMRFELTMKLFFGKKANQIAGEANTPKHRAQWVKKALSLIMKKVDAIETTPRHKELLLTTNEFALEALRNGDQPTWDFVYRLLAMIGRLLGFDYHEGAQLHTLSYWQTEGQYYCSDLIGGGNGLQNYYDQKNAVNIRRDVIEMLKSEGHSDFKIALVMKTTEYEVQKLRGAKRT